MNQYMNESASGLAYWCTHHLYPCIIYRNWNCNGALHSAECGLFTQSNEVSCSRKANSVGIAQAGWKHLKLCAKIDAVKYLGVPAF